MRVRLPCKFKPYYYTESRVVDAASAWKERNVWYSGRSLRYALKKVSMAQGNEAMLNAEKSAEAIVVKSSTGE